MIQYIPSGIFRASCMGDILREKMGGGGGKRDETVLVLFDVHTPIQIVYS
jgi:hypothetical protein